MSLFQNTVVKKYSNSLDQKMVEAKWQLFTTIFHNIIKQDNIRNSKEEQYQAIFLNDLFVQVLGYTQHPNTDYNLITEQKNETNSKKADGAIIINNNVHAVIELKGTETTDLSKIETQAFGYKNNQKDCTYVIISNFEKLRFYIDNATECVEFNLFKLNREEFNLLFICLSLESIQNDLPKKIKNESVSNEDKITKELYKDYSAFRKELFTDIEQINPQYDRLLLFKKTQKLLDRFLFIFFAEDRQLLPTNLIFSINLEWQKLREARVPVSLYDRYKMYFQDLNTGARVSLPAFGKHTNEIVTAQYDIYAYNGGLFQPDDVLDNIAINDDLLYKHTKKLSDYDFESEVDVNILGHIFENSLNEIDEITESLSTKTTETLEGFETLRGFDKTKTKRKKDGVFYTPKYITKYIVDNTIGKLCEEKKTELALDETKYTTDKRITVATKKKLIETLDGYRKWLLQLTIVDPACGSGAFLNQALEFLIAEHRYVDELQAKLFGDALVLSDVEGSILENNLFGVDLNEESVEIAKLSLWLRTAQRNRKLNSLNNNIKCGNSLIDDATIAGDKAFHWHNEFPQVFAKGGFDVVIGNPPYGIIISENEQNYFKKNYPLTSYKTNLYILFVERMMQIFNDSFISLIIPKSLLNNTYYSDLRKHLVENTKIIELFSITEKVFPDAEVGGSLIITYIPNKKYLDLENQIKLISTNLFLDYPSNCIQTKIKQNHFLNVPNNEISIVSSNLEKIKNKILKFKTLNNYYNVKNGLNPGNIKHILINENKIDENHKPIIWGKDISKYKVNWSGEYVNYNDKIIDNISIDDIKSKEGMKAQTKIDFALRNKDLFEIKKIVIRKTGDSLIAALDENNNYFDTLVHGIYIKNINYDLKFLLSILNSKVATSFYRILHDIKGKVFAKISVDNLSSFPLPSIKPNDQQPFIEKADLMLMLNKSLQEVSLKFSKYFSGKFKIEKLSGKLEKWYDVTFEEFIKEVNKAIKAQKGIPLTKKDEFEWIDLFEENKQKANALQSEIGATDKAINAMVYKLYGLSEEEIGIVENS